MQQIDMRRGGLSNAKKETRRRRYRRGERQVGADVDPFRAWNSE